MSEPILRLEGIDKMYNCGLNTQISVLAGLDLQIAPGQVVALVAPSGAGKSTLLHIAGLLDTADAGRVEIDHVTARYRPEGVACDGTSTRPTTSTSTTTIPTSTSLP